jgi:WD40 repeat protein
MILPAADRGADFKRPAAEKLVDDLRRIRVQRSGGVTEELGPTVEPVQLQVACRQLWSRLDEHASAIDLDDIEAIGDVDRALASYYADCVGAAAAETDVSERAIRDWFEYELVTPQGIRGQVLSGPRQDSASSGRAVTMLTDAHLVRAESRRAATWYELAHDRLIEPVKEDNERWRKEHLPFERLATLWDERSRPDQALLSGNDLAEAEGWAATNPDALSAKEREFVKASRKAADQAERERWATKRTRRWLVVAVVGCAFAALAAVDAQRARQSADESAKAAEVSGVTGKAAGIVGFDVDLGLLLAQQAALMPGGSPNKSEIQDALQLAVDQSPVIAVLRGHGPATAAAYSRDGRFIATHHNDDNFVVVWDATSSEELYQLRGPKVGLAGQGELEFSPDGTRLAAIASNGTVAVWPTTQGAGGPTLIRAHQDSNSWSIGFSPDGTRIASAGNPLGLSVVGETGRLAAGFDTPSFAEVDANEVEWTSNGKRVVAAERSGVVSLWNGETGKRLRTVHTFLSEAIAVETSGSMVASASEGLVVVTDLTTNEIIYKRDQPGIADISFSSDGSRLILFDQFGTATVVDPNEAVPRYVTANGMSFVSTDIDPTDPNRAVVATEAGDPAVWNVSLGHTEFESAVEALPTGGVVTASYDGSVIAWSADMAPRPLFSSREDPIWDAAVTSNGNLIAVARESGDVEVWTVTAPHQVLSQSMRASASAVALSPDGRRIAAGDSDGRVVVWDVSTGEEVSTLENAMRAGVGRHTDAVVSLDFGKDYTQLVSASMDKTAIVWNVDSSAPIHRIWLGTPARSIAWNSPGTLIAVGGEDGSVQFWNPKSGLRLHADRTSQHAKAVNDIAFDSTGRRLVSASDDRLVIIWNAADGSVLSRVRQRTEVETTPWRVTFSTDGDRVVVGDGSGVPHVVFLRGDELLRVAQERTTRKMTAPECRLYLGDESDCLEE